MLNIAIDTNVFVYLRDSIVVASALEAGCDRLYTEDMQHGLIVENQLKIVNPFL